jgi:hypothetical protein
MLGQTTSKSAMEPNRMRRTRIATAVVTLTVAALFSATAPAGAQNPAEFGPFAATPFTGVTHGSVSSTSPLVAKEAAVLTDKGISPARAAQVLDVQSKVAEVNLPSRLQAAMARDYAGVWFDNAAAQLNVGAASPGGQRSAQDVVAQAGLAGDVHITPVRSTMAELLAVQNEWNGKLASLFAQRNLQTSIEPQHNAIAITLSSAVPARLRAALKREAATAGVNVRVSVLASPHIEVVEEANECNNFAEGPNCNPSITSGVGVQRPEETINSGTGTSHSNTTLDGFAAATLTPVLPGDAVDGSGILAGTRVTAKPTSTSVTLSKAALTSVTTTFTFLTGASCTAGPTAIPTAARTERVVLTAGHCIEAGHGVGQEWLAFTRPPLEQPLIGKTVAFSNGSSAGDLLGDFGDIKVEAAGGWQTGTANNPVRAVTAEWQLAENTRYPVGGERLATVNAEDCHEGQVSGEKCGLVTALNVSITGGNGKVKEGLVEDNATSSGGDSGGPWLYAASAGRTTHEALMEGTHVGKNNATGRTFFDPLKQSVAGAAAGSLEVLGLELLTTANEFIPRPPIWKVAGKELEGSKKGTGSNEGAFTLKASSLITIECKTATSQGAIKGPRTDEIESTFKECALPGKTSEECHVKSPGGATGTLKTKLATSELVYLGTEKEVREGLKLGDLLSSKEGKVLLEIEVAGTKCPIGTTGTNKVEGSVATELSPSGSQAKTIKGIFPSTAIATV